MTSPVVVPLPLAMRIRRDPLIRSGLRRSSSVIDWMIASTRLSSSSSISAFFSSFGMPGIIPIDARQRAHLLELLHLLEEVVEGELALEQLGRGGLGLVLLVDLFGLLDEA